MYVCPHTYRSEAFYAKQIRSLRETSDRNSAAYSSNVATMAAKNAEEIQALHTELSLRNEIIQAARAENDALKADLAHSKNDETAQRSQVATLRTEAAHNERRWSEELRREKAIAAESLQQQQAHSERTVQDVRARLSEKHAKEVTELREALAQSEDALAVATADHERSTRVERERAQRSLESMMAGFREQLQMHERQLSESERARLELETAKKTMLAKLTEAEDEITTMRCEAFTHQTNIPAHACVGHSEN